MKTMMTAIAALAILSAAGPASAADSYGDGLTTDFFNNLSIPGLVPNCCSDADCKRTRAEFVDGHWIAESAWWAGNGRPGEYVAIPDDRVTARQSPFDATAVICEAEQRASGNVGLKTAPSGLAVNLYCFAPPPIGF